MTPRNFPRTWAPQALTRKEVGVGGLRGELGFRRTRAARANLGRIGVHSPAAPSLWVFLLFNFILALPEPRRRLGTKCSP